MIYDGAINVDTIFRWINTGGVVALLVLILVSGARRYWIFGWQYKELEERNKRIEESNAMWMQIALRGVNLSEQAVQTVVRSDHVQKD